MGPRLAETKGMLQRRSLLAAPSCSLLLLIMTQACSASDPLALEDEDEFTCTAPSLEEVKTASAWDYIAVRDFQVASTRADALPADGTSPPLQPPKTILSAGEPCRTAQNVERCRTNLATALAARDRLEGWNSPESAISRVESPSVFTLRQVIVTTGDAVVVVGSFDALLRFLGPIDTPVEAQLIFDASREASPTVACRRAVGGVHELIVSGDSCGNPYRMRIRVYPDGRIETIERKSEDRGTVC